MKRSGRGLLRNNVVLSIVSTIVMSGCVGSSDAPAVNADAGADMNVLTSQYITLDAVNSMNLVSSEALSYSWWQVSGPNVQLESPTNEQQLSFITPAEGSNEIRFELEVRTMDGSDSDLVDIFVEPCEANEHDIFVDCVAPGFGPIHAYTRRDGDGTGQVVENFAMAIPTEDSHIQWEITGATDSPQNEVVKLIFGGNDPEDLDPYDNGWFGIAAPPLSGNAEDERLDLSHYRGGAIQFDIRQTEGELTLFNVSMECYWPCTSEEYNFFTTNDWQTITVSLADLEESGADLSKLTTGLKLHPPWTLQTYRVFEIDNIKLIPEHTRPEPELPVETDVAISKRFWRYDDLNPTLSFWGANILSEETFVGIDLNFGAHKFDNFGWSLHETDGPSSPIIEDYQAFAHGVINLHYTVASYGGSDEGNFSFNINCGWGCLAFPSYRLPRPPIGEETTLEIPVQELIARGVDLSTVLNFNLRFIGQEFDGPEITIHSASISYTPPMNQPL